MFRTAPTYSRVLDNFQNRSPAKKSDNFAVFGIFDHVTGGFRIWKIVFRNKRFKFTQRTKFQAKRVSFEKFLILEFEIADKTGSRFSTFSKIDETCWYFVHCVNLRRLFRKTTFQIRNPPVTWSKMPKTAKLSLFLTGDRFSKFSSYSRIGRRSTKYDFRNPA